MNIETTKYTENSYFYISTGEQSGYYTLRHYRMIVETQPGLFFEGSKNLFHETDEYYQNLSTDWDTAVAKARLMTDGARLVTGFFDLQEFKRNPNHGAWIKVLNMDEIRYNVFPFGKYAGWEIADVYDFEYIAWLIDYMCTKNYGNNTPDHVSRMFRMALILAHGEDWEQWTKDEARKAAFKQARKDAIEAARADCPTGKVVVRGVVVSTDTKSNEWGTRFVMMVKDASGFIVWGTNPAKFDFDKGDNVEFTATVEVSDRDPKFGFYKRPTKIKNLN